MKQRVLVVAPHPDDETLGCGGTLLKHKTRGDDIFCLFITNVFVCDGYSEETVACRQSEIETVVKTYGIEKTLKLDLPASKLDTVALVNLVGSIREIFMAVKPSVVYIPGRNDIHSDHTITFAASVSALKSFRCPFVRRVLMYETISETEFAPPLSCSGFTPNSFSDISEYLEQKIAIMKIYNNELCEHPFPRSVNNIRALATFRGATAGVTYAESFMLLRETW
ncbi:N-acetylglucosaminylphosphatidylinositol deacetylase [Candidatus Magnetobacterium bavaricum]|uniref:N-acetylglucosaminylphosphatidylinositol deacetylase n=1 Tax=Candidatus Magnetobacterium bavaricum TaxID=29290 RepID=A0A0F3GHE0_9BACT|nr:N-acetylglucosaminylphosphatidylinositol deacetylase [Candidatus Magnetobacterium bavaricum]